MVLREHDIDIKNTLKKQDAPTIRARVWTDENILKTIQCFINAPSIAKALQAVEKEILIPVSPDAVSGMLRRLHLPSAISSLMGEDGKAVLKHAKAFIKNRKKLDKELLIKNNKLNTEVNKKLQVAQSGSDDITLDQKIVNCLITASKATLKSGKKGRKRGAYSLRELCNMFDCSPHRVEVAIEKAKLNGYRIEVTDDSICINTKVLDNKSIVGPRPVVKTKTMSKNTIRFAVISDTHFGSAHALEKETADFVNMAYDEFDVRLILHAGDMLAGNNVYRGQQYELKKWACKDQCQICVDTLPVRKDLQYVYILGNHDVDFMKSNGTDPSEIINAKRPDMTCVGVIAARFILDPYNLDIELSHIKTSAHARSWSLEKHLQRTISKHNAPDILFCGHKHTNGYFTPQGVHSCLVPCFETINIYGTYGDFYPTIGGIIVTVTLDTDGRITRFNPLFHTYPIEFQSTVHSSEIL